MDRFFLKNGTFKKLLEKEIKNNSKFEKSQIFRKILKQLKKELTEIYSCFLNKKSTNLLDFHKSTNERKNDYEIIYEKIFQTFNSKKIFDICCGYNPVSYNLLKNKNLTFECYDLNKFDMNFLNSYFKKEKINGKAIDLDIYFNYKEIKTQKEDLIFLFKALDSLEFRKQNFSKDLLKFLKAENLVVSFSKVNLTNKKTIKNEKRNWFRNFLKKENWTYEEFETGNELFFLIKK